MLKPAFQSAQSGVRQYLKTVNQKKLVDRSEFLLTWLGPSIGIPVMRYFYGDGKEDRTKMFIRDGLTYMTGCAVFLAGKPFLQKGLQKVKPLADNPHMLRLASFTSALSGYVLFSSLLAPRISKKLAEKPEEKPVSEDRFVKSQTFPLHSGGENNVTPVMFMARKPDRQTPFAGTTAARPATMTNYFRGASPQWNIFR